MKSNDIASEEIALFCRLNMQVKRKLPIRSSEMGLLIYVDGKNNGAKPLEISNFFQLAKPTVAIMINELISKGYLFKVPSQEDKRSYHVKVSKQGSNLISRTKTDYYKTIEVLRDKMSEDTFNQFIDLIMKANEIISEEVSL